MKKYLLSLMTIVMVAMASMCFVSCGDDDDDEGGGGSSTAKMTVKLGSRTFSFDYAFWYYFEKQYRIVFTNTDIEKVYKGTTQEKINILEIHVRDKEGKGSLEELPTGTFGEDSYFGVTLFEDIDITNGREKAVYEGNQTKKSPEARLTISKIGNDYTISVTGLDFYDGDDEVTLIQSNTSFSYTGSVPNKDALVKELSERWQNSKP